MFWNVRAEQRAEFGDWHSHEHFPERMSIPGFRRGSRWTSRDDAEGFFVLYELEEYGTLTSKAYLDRLNAPTPWSTKMMPHHLNMVRSQCRVAASFGGGMATALATIRLSPAPGKEAHLSGVLADALADLAVKPGVTGGHLLVTDTPRQASPTAEQKIRGSDRAADWIVLVSGYDIDALRSFAGDRLSPRFLHRAGAAEPFTTGFFQLAFSMTSVDVASLQ